MNDKDLRKLSRRDLLEILVEQGERIEELEKELSEARGQLSSREIRLEAVGSIAEASLQLNRVFQAAEDAAEQYLENVRRVGAEREAALEERDASSRLRAAQIIADARAEAEKILRRAPERPLPESGVAVPDDCAGRPEPDRQANR